MEMIFIKTKQKKTFSKQDLILKTFQELWFSEKIGELKSNTVEFGIHERAQLLLSVVSSVHQHEWLIDLLEKVSKENYNLYGASLIILL